MESLPNLLNACANKRSEVNNKGSKLWQYEDDPEKAMVLAMQEIADIWSIEDDPEHFTRIIRIQFKKSYNPTGYYTEGSIE